MKIRLVAIVAALGWSALAMVTGSHAQEAGLDQQQTAQEKANIAVVQVFWRLVHQEHHGDVAPKYLADAYVEHNNGGINGSARMAQVFSRQPPAGFQQKTVAQSVYALGEVVLLHQHRVAPDRSQPGKTNTTNMIEMIRVFNGRLQEHWMFFPEGHTPANQPQTEQEEKNIAVVKGFWRDVWEGRNGSAVPEYVAEGYIENGAGAVNGRADVVRRFGGPLPAESPQAKVVSQTIYARGPFVLLHQHRSVSDPSQPGKPREVNLIEMFQVNDGLIQEHWVFFSWEHGAPASWGEG